MAVGNIRTADFDSALPSGNMEFFCGTAMNPTGFRINDRYPKGHILSVTYGAKLNLKMNKTNAIGITLNAIGSNFTWELNTKHVLQRKKQRYLSIAPAVLFTQFTKDKSIYEVVRHDEGRVWGGKIPLILTLDTNRNLQLSFSAALSCYWVSAKGYCNEYHNEFLTDHTPYNYGTMPTLMGQLNCNLIADSGIWIVRPSFGVSFIDAHERGVQTELAGGLSLGLAYKQQK